MTSSPFPLYVFTPVRQRKCSIVLPVDRSARSTTADDRCDNANVNDDDRRSDKRTERRDVKIIHSLAVGPLMEGYDDATYHEIAADSEMPIDRDTKAKQTLDRFIADATASQSP